MTTSTPDMRLRDRCAAGGGRWVRGLAGAIDLPPTLGAGTTLGGRYAGRSVVVAVADPLDAVRLMLALDGVAARMVLVPPGTPSDQWPAIMAAAGADALIADPAGLAGAQSSPARGGEWPVADTEWVLLTSGSTGQPKLVAHSLGSLVGGDFGQSGEPPVWSTFYDVRRYGGLQILLRALTGHGSMVLADAQEPVAAFLARAGAAGVTHISGTPSHWRRVLLTGQAALIDPRYVRLSGEIADQATLDRLRAAYPQAAISHAFASTEAGVGFDVDDGQEGFPAAWVLPGHVTRAGAELRVQDGTLRIRSTRVARGYLGHAAPLAMADGFVNTGDLVALQGDRYRFLGRAGGVINVGGQKVYPEEVEAALQAHPAVLAARVHARPSPITGALVVAEIVVHDLPPSSTAQAALRDAIIAGCRQHLAPHKVPALLTIAERIDVAASGKLARHAA